MKNRREFLKTTCPTVAFAFFGVSLIQACSSSEDPMPTVPTNNGQTNTDTAGVTQNGNTITIDLNASNFSGLASVGSWMNLTSAGVLLLRVSTDTIRAFMEICAPGARRLRPIEVIEHFDGVVQGELDLRLESSAASEFAANAVNDEGFQLPKIKWEYSARRVMTLGWADGAPMGDNDAIDAAGHKRALLGDRVLQLFLSHALRDGYFHADMHQGNLKVAPNGDIIAYDFGIMGHIDEYTRRVYAEILYGFICKDYKRVAQVHFEAGYVPADKDVDEFARALRAVGEPIFGMDASQMSMGRLFSYLFEVTERFGMETRTELILLQRTMVVVEGVARSLNPQINIWEVASPIVTDYITKSIGPKAVLSDLGKTARVLARFGPRLPVLVEGLLAGASVPSQHLQL